MEYGNNADTSPYAQKLMEAICKGKKSEAAILIENGTPAQLFAQDKTNLSGKTPLYYAITQPDTQTALLLINKKGATAEHIFRKEKRHGYTPLHEAIALENKEVIMAIINKPDVGEKHLKEIKNDAGESALDFAKKLHKNYIVHEINKKINTEKKLQGAQQLALPEKQATQQLSL